MSQDNHNPARGTIHGLAPDQVRGEWVRQQTLILLRWLAIIGQSVAIVVSVQFLGVQLELWACIAAIAALAFYNLYLAYQTRLDQRLTSEAALTSHTIDIVQLLFMLYLTGGLSNPFALLLLAPVTISATTLRIRATIFLGAIAIFGITTLVYVYQPLVLQDGRILKLSQLQVWVFGWRLLLGSFFFRHMLDV